MTGHDSKANPNRSRLRDRRVRAFVSWALIAGFLLQPVLTYLVTPVVGHDAKGHTIVVCTMNGQQLVELDLSSVLGQFVDEQDPNHCPALKLYQMAGTAQASAPFVTPDVLLYSVASSDQSADLPHRSLHFCAYSTRAPPVIS